MSRSALLALLTLSLILSACGSAPPRQAAPPSNTQLEFRLASGTYGCEGGVRLQVARELRDQLNYRITLGWNGGTYQLDRDPSYSGLPRFVDAASGLVWIDLPWKSVLLDGKTNTPLVSECRPGS